MHGANLLETVSAGMAVENMIIDFPAFNNGENVDGVIEKLLLREAASRNGGFHALSSGSEGSAPSLASGSCPSRTLSDEEDRSSFPWPIKWPNL